MRATLRRAIPRGLPSDPTASSSSSSSAGAIAAARAALFKPSPHKPTASASPPANATRHVPATPSSTTACLPEDGDPSNALLTSDLSTFTPTTTDTAALLRSCNDHHYASPSLSSSSFRDFCDKEGHASFYIECLARCIADSDSDGESDARSAVRTGSAPTTFEMLRRRARTVVEKVHRFLRDLKVDFKGRIAVQKARAGFGGGGKGRTGGDDVSISISGPEISPEGLIAASQFRSRDEEMLSGRHRHADYVLIEREKTLQSLLVMGGGK